MNWKQFKETVEAAGVTDEMDIFFIDTGTLPSAEELHVIPQKTSQPEGLSVSPGGF